jgi:ribonuclease-3
MKNILKYKTLLKINFKDKSLAESALTHKSANQKINNEKLEFLGDRVIGLVISKKLFDLYPNESEGVLDKRFATLVKKKTCSDVAWNLGLQNLIITGNQKRTINRNDEKILSDCCEAIIGAIFIDRGFDYVRKFILKAWKKNLDKSDVTILDSKTKLQEYSLKKYKKLPFYQVVNSTGPKHNPLYKISVSILQSKPFIGTGKSKQEAEQDGANRLLNSLDIK